MILVRVLQANIQMVGMFLSNIGITIFGTFVGTQPVNGIMWYLAPINGPHDWMWWAYDLLHPALQDFWKEETRDSCLQLRNHARVPIQDYPMAQEGPTERAAASAGSEW
jgi:hypothetical protein